MIRPVGLLMSGTQEVENVERTQFVVVSHNRATMEAARALYGISMDTVGVSTVVSLKLPTENATPEPAHATNGTAVT